MLKLLRANYMRLWKDKIFLFSAVLMFLYGILIQVVHYLDNINESAGWTLDFGFFTYTMAAAVLLSIVNALYIGCEYSDGTMRNKISVGHNRGSIYLSNLIVSISAGALLCASYALSAIPSGYMLLGGFTSEPSAVLMYVGLSLLLISVFSAIFTIIGMLCHNKAYTVACCILCVFLLIFLGVHIFAALNEPEYYDGYSYTENGVTITEEKERNSNYLTGTKREIYEFMQDFTPGGQLIQVSNMNAEDPAMLAVYNCIILVAVTCCGLIVFRRRDLK